MDNDATSNTSTNSKLINAVRGIKSYTGEKPDDFGDWHRKAGFILCMQRPDIFATMEGQARPTEKRIKPNKQHRCKRPVCGTHLVEPYCNARPHTTAPTKTCTQSCT